MGHPDRVRQGEICRFQGNLVDNLWNNGFVDLDSVIRKVSHGPGLDLAQALDFIKAGDDLGKYRVGPGQLGLVGQGKEDFAAGQDQFVVAAHAGSSGSDGQGSEAGIELKFIWQEVLGLLFAKSVDALIMPEEGGTRTEKYVDLNNDWLPKADQNIAILLTHLNAKDVIQCFVQH